MSRQDRQRGWQDRGRDRQDRGYDRQNRGYDRQDRGQDRQEKGRHLSLDDVKLFERAMDAYGSIKGTDAAEDFFVSLNQDLKGKEMMVAQHKTCSRFMEKYIKECPIESLQHLMVVFSSHFKDLSMDKFASHCVEKLILQCLEYFDVEISPGFPELLSSFISELTPEAGNLAEDGSGSHVVRVVLNELSKVDNYVQKIDKFARKIVQHLIQNPHLMRRSQFSATLQDLAGIDATKYSKLLKYLATSVPLTWEMISDKSGSRLAECMIQMIGGEVNTGLFKAVFRESVFDAIDNPIANFVLQKWLEFNNSDEEIEAVSARIVSKFAEILGKRPQVIVSLSAGLVKCSPSAQRKFMDALIAEAGSANLIEYLHSLAQPNGAKIAQCLCSFNGGVARPFVEAMKSLGGEKLKEFAADKSDSYFVSEFVRAPLQSIDRKSKNKIVRRLITGMKDLACGTFGQHVVDAAFQSSEMELKIEICKAIDSDDVKKAQPRLWKNLRMDQFRTRREQWEKDTENISKREKAMADVMKSVDVPEVKKVPAVVSEPSEAVAAAAEEVAGELGTLKKRRRKHHHHEE